MTNSTTYTNKTDRALDRAWTKAAAAGDHATIANLRLAFESLDPVDVKLSPRQVERLQDEYQEEQRFSVLNQTRVVFHSTEAAEEAADCLESGADEAVDLAFSAVCVVLSDAQYAFLERSTRRSIATATRKIRQATARVVGAR